MICNFVVNLNSGINRYAKVRSVYSSEHFILLAIAIYLAPDPIPVRKTCSIDLSVKSRLGAAGSIPYSRDLLTLAIDPGAFWLDFEGIWLKEEAGIKETRCLIEDELECRTTTVALRS